jgi:hypothetical protein
MRNLISELREPENLEKQRSLHILIIEDVQDWSWIDVLKSAVPEHLRQFIKVYDLRPNKQRYDDIVFTIDRS